MRKRRKRAKSNAVFCTSDVGAPGKIFSDNFCKNTLTNPMHCGIISVVNGCNRQFTEYGDVLKLAEEAPLLRV